MQLAECDLGADAGEKTDRARCAEKSARKPSRRPHARSSNPPAAMAVRLVSATYRGPLAEEAKAALIMAAVAESAATTRCRDEPKTAKASMGSRSV